ncbi:hypothetical protein GCM10012280_57290 [Wenjunlia tyrosinilytica]|uniref:Uncharacterized protein n=1 Tax=Wenjunlia tyrosinilytica TaxID=1544741 RepID=A0A918E0E1_9ACTN|nr:hypothetical protein [Wenjunlia tyrosinilytica]GGO96845.1 hypothetical protein GCM10012280_57290 [Wenjunlia tyrosinilytica]
MEEPSGFWSAGREPGCVIGLGQGSGDARRAGFGAADAHVGVESLPQPRVRAADGFGQLSHLVGSGLCVEGDPARPSVAVLHDNGFKGFTAQRGSNVGCAAEDIDIWRYADPQSDVPSVEAPAQIGCTATRFDLRLSGEMEQLAQEGRAVSGVPFHYEASGEYPPLQGEGSQIQRVRHRRGPPSRVPRNPCGDPVLGPAPRGVRGGREQQFAVGDGMALSGARRVGSGGGSDVTCDADTVAVEYRDGQVDQNMQSFCEHLRIEQLRPHGSRHAADERRRVDAGPCQEGPCFHDECQNGVCQTSGVTGVVGVTGGLPTGGRRR